MIMTMINQLINHLITILALTQQTNFKHNALPKPNYDHIPSSLSLFPHMT